MRLGWSGMSLAIDGRAGASLRHLRQGINPRLGYSVGGLGGRQRPVHMPSLPKPSRLDCNPSAFLACLKTLVSAIRLPF
jgi:hypothetical protein